LSCTLEDRIALRIAGAFDGVAAVERKSFDVGPERIVRGGEDDVVAVVFFLERDVIHLIEIISVVAVVAVVVSSPRPPSSELP
jgi:hypothetical protein